MSKKKIKFIATVIVVLLLLGIALGVIGYYSNGFKNWEKFKPNNWIKAPDQNAEVQAVGGSVLKPIINNGVSFVADKISYSDYSSNGIVETADSAYKLTATIIPDIAENKAINWTARWANVSSTWAQDKEISDYLTLSKEFTQSGEAVNIICLQDFGEQIIITASAEADSLKKAECTVDYLRKIKDIQFKFSITSTNFYEENFELGSDNVYRFNYSNNTRFIKVIPEITYSDYTIYNDYEIITVGKFANNFGLDESIVLNEALFAYGLFDYKDPGSHFHLNDNRYKFCRNVMDIGCGVDSVANIFAYESSEMSYNKLTIEEKRHPLVSMYREAMLQTTIELEKWQKVQDYISLYEPEKPYSFIDIDIMSFNDFFKNAIKCNQENKGIVEYTLTFKSAIAVYERKISLGFTTSSLESFIDIEIDNGEIII